MCVGWVLFPGLLSRERRYRAGEGRNPEHHQPGEGRESEHRQPDDRAIALHKHPSARVSPALA
jgi:hypothetical protein